MASSWSYFKQQKLQDAASILGQEEAITSQMEEIQPTKRELSVLEEEMKTDETLQQIVPATTDKDEIAPDIAPPPTLPTLILMVSYTWAKQHKSGNLAE